MADSHIADGDPSTDETPQVLKERSDPYGPTLEESTALLAVDYGRGAAVYGLTSGQVRDLAGVISKGRDAIGAENLTEEMERKTRSLIRTLEAANDGTPREQEDI